MILEEFGSELDGRATIVTGALPGISSATAKSLVSRGASVVVAARREGELEELAATIEDDGGDALVVLTDVIADDDTDALIEAALGEHGRTGILASNAGLMPLVHIDGADRKTLQTTIDVNPTGLIAFIHAVILTMMKQKSGHIVSLPSVAGRFLQANNSHYSVAKAGAKMFSSSLRFDIAEASIHVSPVKPGAADTELLDRIPDEEAQGNAKDCVGTVDALAPEGIARMVTFVVT